MFKYILEIKEGSYADHEYPAEEWHRIELDLDSAKMRPLVRCRDCKWFEALSSNGFPVLDKRGKQIIRCERECLSLPDDNGFCAWGERKQDDQLRMD